MFWLERYYLKKGKLMSKKYTLNRENLWKIFKVILWSGMAAVIASLIAVLKEIDIPAQWVWAVPIINTILYSLKEFFSGE